MLALTNRHILTGIYHTKDLLGHSKSVNVVDFTLNTKEKVSRDTSVSNPNPLDYEVKMFFTEAKTDRKPSTVDVTHHATVATATI
jgi:hypothetical protein